MRIYIRYIKSNSNHIFVYLIRYNQNQEYEYL